MTDHPAESEIDALLSALADQQRRIILVMLGEKRRSLTLRDLAGAILRHNHQVPLSKASTEEATRVQLRLHHRHVPKLEDAGLVEHDAERRLVTPTEQFDDIDPLLALIEDYQAERSPDWPR